MPRPVVIRVLAEFTSTKFFRFLLAGGLAAVVNVASRHTMSGVLSYSTSIVVAYTIGMVVAYLLNRMLVFGHGDRTTGAEVGWFVLVNIAGVLQTLAVSLLLARVILAAFRARFPVETLAHGVGVAVPAFTSFLGHKYLTFRKVAPSSRSVP